MRRSRQRYPEVEKQGVLTECSHGNGLLQAEFEQRFARDFDLLTAGEHLHPRTCCGTRASTNRCASATAGDCPDDRAERRAASDFFGGVAATSLAFQRVVAAHDGIVLAVDDHARQLELQL